MQNSSFDHDLHHCSRILAAGSKSFRAASMLLPRRVRDPATAIYAFCRIADDEIDLGAEPKRAVATLLDRLERAYRGLPLDHPLDRAFSAAVLEHRVPRSAPQALLEGLWWDVQQRRYEDLPDLLAYCARVASSVGVMMSALMGARAPLVLARAADLGAAMQLTNIARDVAEDARAGRLYLPVRWLDEAKVRPGQVLFADSLPGALTGVVERLLAEADRLYTRAELGIPHLPRACRPAIRAARLIYADIGRVIRADPLRALSVRAHVSKGRKLWLLARSVSALARPVEPLSDPPLDQVRFLLEPQPRLVPLEVR